VQSSVDTLAWTCAFRMGDRSVKRNSSCRLLGMRIVRSAALQSARNLLSLRRTAQDGVQRSTRCCVEPRELGPWV